MTNAAAAATPTWAGPGALSVDELRALARLAGSALPAALAGTWHPDDEPVADVVAVRSLLARGAVALRGDVPGIRLTGATRATLAPLFGAEAIVEVVSTTHDGTERRHLVMSANGQGLLLAEREPDVWALTAEAGEAEDLAWPVVADLAETVPGHAIPGHAAPGHAAPGHAAAGHAAPGHAIPGAADGGAADGGWTASGAAVGGAAVGGFTLAPGVFAAVRRATDPDQVADVLTRAGLEPDAVAAWSRVLAGPHSEHRVTMARHLGDGTYASGLVAWIDAGPAGSWRLEPVTDHLDGVDTDPGDEDQDDEAEPPTRVRPTSVDDLHADLADLLADELGEVAP